METLAGHQTHRPDRGLKHHIFGWMRRSNAACPASAVAVLPVVCGMLFLALSGPTVRAADFYEGKSINLVVAYPPADGNDVYARLLARHMGAYIPGHPNFIVNNRPGASGLIGSNFIYNLAPKDGLTFGLISRSVPLQQIMGNPGVRFEATKFNWVGTHSSYQEDAYCLIVRSQVPVKSLDDLRTAKEPLLFGTSAAAGDSFYDIVQISREVFGLNIKLVKGYGSPETVLAMERGELDGRGIGLSALRQFRPTWLENGDVRCLLQFGHKTRYKALPDVPTAQELVKTPEERALVDLVELPLLMSRPYALPPDVPPDRVKVLRDAFMATHQDPAFIAEAKKIDLELSPHSGEDIDGLLAEIGKIPSAVVQRYVAALAK
jgi:tripartite-type tricarboxylate transporter receptor subunit TctC